MTASLVARARDAGVGGWRCLRCDPIPHGEGPCDACGGSPDERPIMTAKRPAPGNTKIVTVVGNPETLKPKLKCVGGSQSDEWNGVLADQTVNTLWLVHSESWGIRFLIFETVWSFT